jgi:L-histidine Nalpha-methyltransferase
MMPDPAATRPNAVARLRMTTLRESHDSQVLAADVLHGLTVIPKELPPKYFYDARGALLFDAICDTEEYYPTRTEQELLEQVAGEIMARVRPTALVELGSGAARKTRVLLDQMTEQVAAPCYMPVDISAEMLRHSAQALLGDYPSLRVHGVVADYDQHLSLLPRAERRLIAFLGSTIGNFEQPRAVEFVRAIAAGMGPDDQLLLGLDLVKSPAVLHAAYNDSQGITAEFNRNVLRVINRALGADFEPDHFEHIARYLPEQEQIEMALRARRGHTVRIAGLKRAVRFAPGEELRTEISRKFTRRSAELLIRAAGLDLSGWYVSDNGYVALALATVY